MVVKEIRGRRRYVAFSVDIRLNKSILITRLRNLSDPAPYVVQCGNGLAVVRCEPNGREAMISLMRNVDPTSEPLMTSGTLKALRSKVPGLKDAPATKE